MVSVVQRERRDVIDDVNTVFSRGRNQRHLKAHFSEILYREKVIASRKALRVVHIRPSSNFFFYAIVSSDSNVFHQKIGIGLKPDHDLRDRKIRLILEIGSNELIQIEENRDDHRMPLKRIVQKEEHDAEKDLRKLIRKYKRKLKAA